MLIFAQVPEDIYKSHLVETRAGAAAAASVDSARQNLASTFVNAFVNAGFGQDKLMTEENNKWLYKNKVHVRRGACLSHVKFFSVAVLHVRVDAHYVYGNVHD